MKTPITTLASPAALIAFTLMTLMSTPVSAKDVCWKTSDGKTWCKKCTAQGRCLPAKEKKQ